MTRTEPNTPAFDLWMRWYGMEATKPPAGTPERDAWSAECARLYTEAKAAEAYALRAGRPTP